MAKKQTMKVAIAWTLLAVTALFLISGFGITQYRLVTPLTFGLLGKATSYQVHEWLWIPFGILLVVHVYLGIFRKKK